MGYAIETDGLAKTFAKAEALKGIDVRIPAGTIFGFLGPNGAGKTTTVRLLTGVLKPSGGQARVLGLDAAADSTEVRRRIGVLTETAGNYERLAARDNLVIFGQLYGLKKVAAVERAGELLKFFGLEERAMERVETFSTGMKKRLLLARALIHEPEVLFLDEPTSGLDPEAAHHVLELIKGLCVERRRTVFICTHNLDEAQRLCDTVAVIDAGRVLAQGTLKELEEKLWSRAEVVVELEEVNARVAGAVSNFAAEGRGIETAAGREAGGSEGVAAAAAAANILRIPLRSHEQIPDLVAEIVRAGGRIRAVQPVKHSLEEIYMKLMRGGGDELAKH